LVKIHLGKMKNRGSEIGAFLEEKLGVAAVVEGSSITIGDVDNTVRVRDVKTYLKRYLHREGLKKEARTRVEGGELNIVPVKQSEE
jgi:hypothetical protein